jgi:hypothetical protein
LNYKRFVVKFIIFFLLFSNCEIKKNPLAPNGPFGIYTLYYNLTRIGEWNYTDDKVLYYSVNEVIPENSPILKNVIIPPFSFQNLKELPLGLNYNPNNGVISGTPTVIQSETDYSFKAKFSPVDSGQNSSSLKINIGDYSSINSVNIPFTITTPFPTTANYENYLISPALPNGVSLDSTTGIISGTATATRKSIYKIKANRTSDGISYIAYIPIQFTEWVNEAYLKAPNADAGDYFGYSVSISGDTIVVGAPREDSNQTTITNGLSTGGNNPNSLSDQGAAYVFRRTGTLWANEAYLKAPNADIGDQFGYFVSISGDTIVVGANQEDSNQTTITNGLATGGNNPDSNANHGAAYVFRRTGSIWTNEAYLKAPNADAGDFFGYSVSISGDTIVVGANQEDSNQTTITNGTQTINGTGATNSGAAYVFRRTGTTWENEAYLKAPNSEGFDQFGSSVSISGDTIVVGSRLENSNQTTITNGTLTISGTGASGSGAVYVFKRNGTTWANEAYLKAPNAESSDIFGHSLSISGDTIVVGAYFEDSNQTTITNGTLTINGTGANDSGAAYVFRRVGSTWINEAYLKAPNADAGDFFGESVSISGNTIVVGATRDDSNQTTITNGTLTINGIGASDSGAAYVFSRTGSTWLNESYLKAPNAGASDQFGISVSISEDTIAVGANQEDSNQITITNGTLTNSNNLVGDSGAVYVFRRK